MKIFYLAFKVSGISTGEINSSHNWVGYQFRRAWGEDLCENPDFKPVYADGAAGARSSISRSSRNGTNVGSNAKLTGAMVADPWQAFESNVYYAGTIYGADWRGELRIPWKAINDPAHDSKHDTGQIQGRERATRDVAIQFLRRHKSATGESASLGGARSISGGTMHSPVVLVLREPDNPGMNNPNVGNSGKRAAMDRRGSDRRAMTGQQ